MKIAYTMIYEGKDFEEITENIDQLLDQGDHVFLILNDEDLHDQLILSYCNEPAFHMVQGQPGALAGDLSSARGVVVSIKEALAYQENADIQFDAFINLTDGMIPIKSKSEIDAYIQSYKDQDIYFVKATSNEDPTILERWKEYSLFTNSMDFQKSRFIQGINSITAKAISNFKHKEIDDVLVLSYPWFILTPASAKALAENLAYCSDTFKMCQYPEEMAIATMLHKFSNVEHHNENVWVCGNDGEYVFEKPIKPTSLETIESHPNALFAAKIHSTDNLYTYQETFDLYNQKKS